MTGRLLAAALLGLGLAGGAAADALAPVPPELDAARLAPAPKGTSARAVAKRVEDVFRGRTTYLEGSLEIRSPRLPAPRLVRFRSWEDRPGRRSFIRILAPPKDAGMAFLKLHPNLWNYIPRVERTVRIPPSMMLQSWMGSDFSNDDLVRESSQLDDYDQELLGVDRSISGGPAYVLAYRPHEDAPVVWGRIVTWVQVARAAPLRQDFYDEKGTRLRVLRFEQIRDVQGRPYPHLWVMVPLDRPGHETRVQIQEIRFDEPIDAAVFTKRNLERRP